MEGGRKEKKNFFNFQKFLNLFCVFGHFLIIKSILFMSHRDSNHKLVTRNENAGLGENEGNLVYMLLSRHYYLSDF